MAAGNRVVVKILAVNSKALINRARGSRVSRAAALAERTVRPMEGGAEQFPVKRPWPDFGQFSSIVKQSFS